MSCGVKEEVFLGTTLLGIGCWGLVSVNLKEANRITVTPLNAVAGVAERNSRTTKTEVEHSIARTQAMLIRARTRPQTPTEYGRFNFVVCSWPQIQIPVSKPSAEITRTEKKSDVVEGN